MFRVQELRAFEKCLNSPHNLYDSICLRTASAGHSLIFFRNGPHWKNNSFSKLNASYSSCYQKTRDERGSGDKEKWPTPYVSVIFMEIILCSSLMVFKAYLSSVWRKCVYCALQNPIEILNTCRLSPLNAAF